MKTNTEPNREGLHFSQSTYAMILRSEDRRRNILEIVLYSVLMLSLLATLVPLGKNAVALRSMPKTRVLATASPQL